VGVDFCAIDFETANSSPASACQVGLARVRDGAVVETASWLIRPVSGHDEFNVWNTRIHGITADHVAGALGWREQFPQLCDFIGDDVLVAHNAGFDTGVLRKAASVSGDACPEYRYLCSLQVARKVYDLPSYKLPLAAEAAGFTGFAHHDAAADALACAHIAIDAARRHAAADLDDLAARIGVAVRAIHPIPAPVA
jgi:DNA polymerase-3 subunit epsilon